MQPQGHKTSTIDCLPGGLPPSRGRGGLYVSVTLRAIPAGALSLGWTTRA